MKTRSIEELVGKTLVNIKGKIGGGRIVFNTTDGKVYKLYHEQGCCEDVSIDDIVGNLDDLIGSPILIAREDTNSDEPGKGEYIDSYTWTFYNLATANGHVTIRWYGTSNGYYSESVDFVEL
jgi:hypothetical protein